MYIVDIECVMRYQANKTYALTEEEYNTLLKTGIIPQKIKDDIMDYSRTNGEEKINYVIRSAN